jgi:hypothetical protein
MTGQRKSGKKRPGKGTSRAKKKPGRTSPGSPAPRAAVRSAGTERDEGWAPPIELAVDAELEAARPSVADRARRTAASMTGEEEPGGTVAVPEHDSVDEWAAALGVERPADAPVRASADLLDERDRNRGPRES